MKAFELGVTTFEEVMKDSITKNTYEHGIS